MGEVNYLPGLDERAWTRLVPKMRAAIYYSGLGDAAADAILANLKPRLLRAAPFATERATAETVRIVSKAYFDLIGEMLGLAIELYVAKNYAPMPVSADDAPA